MYNTFSFTSKFIIEFQLPFKRKLIEMLLHKSCIELITFN